MALSEIYLHKTLSSNITLETFITDYTKANEKAVFHSHFQKVVTIRSCKSDLQEYPPGQQGGYSAGNNSYENGHQRAAAEISIFTSLEDVGLYSAVVKA